MAGKEQYTAKDFIDAIPGTGGIITAIARKVGCSWNTAQKYIDTHPTVKQAYDDECESMLDLAETTILTSIRSGDSGDAKWYLSRKGKQRGYVERQELDHTTKGEKIESGDDERFDRAISTLADAVRESVSGKGTEQDGKVGSTE